MEKATELGAREVIPLATERSPVSTMGLQVWGQLGKCGWGARSKEVIQVATERSLVCSIRSTSVGTGESMGSLKALVRVGPTASCQL